MATNRYPRLTGSKKIKQDYIKINESLDMIEDDVRYLEDGVIEVAREVTETQESTAQSINNVQEQINTLVINGDSSAAAAQAAIDANGHNYGNLKVRLDAEHEQVTSQLADTEQRKADKTEVNELATAKADKADVISLVTEVNQKADTEYVDNLVGRLGNMSPKDAFPTLATLQATYPTGADGLYLVSETNHWYYWNGTAWTDGGAYQAMPWAEFMTTQDEPWEV